MAYWLLWDVNWVCQSPNAAISSSFICSNWAKVGPVRRQLYVDISVALSTTVASSACMTS